jgi:NAD(P)-dependent dehydrogenase (short-subunit alcohol dehydrogenase family)
VEVAVMDLASLASVRDWAQRAQDFGHPLDVLVLNAGGHRRRFRQRFTRSCLCGRASAPLLGLLVSRLGCCGWG